MYIYIYIYINNVKRPQHNKVCGKVQPCQPILCDLDEQTWLLIVIMFSFGPRTNSYGQYISIRPAIHMYLYIYIYIFGYSTQDP